MYEIKERMVNFIDAQIIQDASLLCHFNHITRSSKPTKPAVLRFKSHVILTRHWHEEEKNEE